MMLSTLSQVLNLDGQYCKTSLVSSCRHLHSHSLAKQSIFPMKDLDSATAISLLNRIMEFELAGVVRYTHYGLMVIGPNRLPIVEFFKSQASESLLHAQEAGEIITGLEGHPRQRIAPIEETHQHAVRNLLQESLNHEQMALHLYKEFLEVVENASIYLEEYARTKIGEEEMHTLEIKKMLRDFS